MKLNGNKASLSADHTYFRYEAERSEITDSCDIYHVVSSTSMKIVENTEESICSPILKTVDNTILEESFETLTIKDDSKDHDFSVKSLVADGSGEEEETTVSQEQNFIKKPKYIVF